MRKTVVTEKDLRPLERFIQQQKKQLHEMSGEELFQGYEDPTLPRADRDWYKEEIIQRCNAKRMKPSRRKHGQRLRRSQ